MSHFQQYETPNELAIRSILEEDRTLKVGYRVLNVFKEPPEGGFGMMMSMPVNLPPILFGVEPLESRMIDSYLEINQLEETVFKQYFGEDAKDFSIVHFEYRGVFHSDADDKFILCFAYKLNDESKKTFLKMIERKEGKEKLDAMAENAIDALTKGVNKLTTAVLNDPQVMRMKQRLETGEKNV